MRTVPIRAWQYYRVNSCYFLALDDAIAVHNANVNAGRATELVICNRTPRGMGGWLPTRTRVLAYAAQRYGEPLDSAIVFRKAMQTAGVS